MMRRARKRSWIWKRLAAIITSVVLGSGLFWLGIRWTGYAESHTPMIQINGVKVHSPPSVELVFHPTLAATGTIGGLVLMICGFVGCVIGAVLLFAPPSRKVWKPQNSTPPQTLHH